MNMQPAVHSRSSANGFGRRRGERDVGTRLENRSQSGKSNSNNRLTSTGSKTGGHGSPSHDRLVYITTCFVGQHVDVHVKNGSIYSGIFHAANEKDFGIILKMARLTKDGSSRGQKSPAESVSKPPAKTLIIPSKELVQVIAKDVSVTSEGFLDEPQCEKQQELMIDSVISQSRHVELERELEPWVPDKDDPQCPELENIFDGHWNRGWDQFTANEALFGVKSTFDEELYTTKLERGPKTRELEKEAQRIAREIEGEDTRDLHLAEERGFQLSGNLDIDEETRFSSVYRGKIADDSGYDEDVLVDSHNNDTFGDSSTSGIYSSADWNKGKSNDVARASSSSCAMDQAQSLHSSVGVDLSRSGSYDHAGKLASEPPFKSSSATTSESRILDNQLCEHGGSVKEYSEKQATSALDGETDLKTRFIPSACMGIDLEVLHKIKGVIECPVPDKDIRRFDANLRLFPPFIDNNLCPLTIKNTILQSCYLRNTEWACGVAVYTGSCFVKFATTIEADKAIAALNNQHFFPGEQMPITVKYAGKPDRERERHGALDKVFVAMFNKEASKEEIMEIFSPYGFVEEVYIILDEMKQSRGCGFVRFSHPDMAVAAIRALNGTYTMRGCDKPIAVRFAEPKKVRNGEARNNKMFSGMSFGPHSQEPVVRTTTNLGDSMVGHNRPNAPHLAQHFSLTKQPQAVSSVANHEPPQLSQMQNRKASSQQFQGEVHDFPRQLHVMQPLKQTLEQHKWSQTSGQPPLPTGSSSREGAYNIPRAAVPANPQMPELPECDWSEHTCPDGHKYYYNCVTHESLWDKPKEYGLFEEQLKNERQQQTPAHKLQSSSLVLSKQQPAQTQEIHCQTHVDHQNLQLEKPALSAPELDHVEVQ